MIRSIAILLVALVVAVPTPADACLNETFRSERQVIRDLQRAERFLAQGRPERALGALLGYGWDDEIDGWIASRYSRVSAVTIVRLDGRVRPPLRSHSNPARPWTVDPHITEADRTQRLTHSLESLDVDDGAPERIQWNAEARLALGQDVAQATAALHQLAHDDLMVDAYGYRALVRHSTGSVRTAFLARCVRLAGAAANRICRVSDAIR